MTVRPAGLDPVMSRLEQSVDRLAFALVVSAFVVGFATLLARIGDPVVDELIAEFALVCAAGVGIWFFLSILFRAVQAAKERLTRTYAGTAHAQHKAALPFSGESRCSFMVSEGGFEPPRPCGH